MLSRRSAGGSRGRTEGSAKLSSCFPHDAAEHHTNPVPRLVPLFQPLYSWMSSLIGVKKKIYIYSKRATNHRRQQVPRVFSPQMKPFLGEEEVWKLELGRKKQNVYFSILKPSRVTRRLQRAPYLQWHSHAPLRTSKRTRTARQPRRLLVSLSRWGHKKGARKKIIITRHVFPF